MPTSRTSSGPASSAATRRSRGRSSSSGERDGGGRRCRSCRSSARSPRAAPLLAEQNVEDELAVPETLRGDFLLRVRGESMIEAGILDGDIVVVRRAQDARNGEIVVALVGDDESADEATVKTFYKEKGRIRLQPENAALEPIYAGHVEILGKVVGVFREL